MASTYRTGKICYIDLPAAAIARSAEFYRRSFGWSVRRRGDGATSFDDTVAHFRDPAGNVLGIYEQPGLKETEAE